MGIERISSYPPPPTKRWSYHGVCFCSCLPCSSWSRNILDCHIRCIGVGRAPLNFRIKEGLTEHRHNRTQTVRVSSAFTTMFFTQTLSVSRLGYCQGSVAHYLFLLQLITLGLACALTRGAPSIVPNPTSNVAGVQLAVGNTRLFYQDSTGQILLYTMVGGVGSTRQLVPADEVLPCTPIAASILGNGATDVSEPRKCHFSILPTTSPADQRLLPISKQDSQPVQV